MFQKISHKNIIICLILLLILILYFVYRNKTNNVAENKTKKNIVFLTYGDKNFKKSRERIINEAKQLDLFTDCIMETENIFNEREFKKLLTNKRFKQVAHSKRGGGYWIWKPYILYKHLSNLNEGDILVYSDAGCQITDDINTVNSFNDIFHKIQNTDTNMLLNELPNQRTERYWTKGDVLDYYNIYDNNDIINSAQLESGRVFLIKNDKTMEIISKWWDVAKNHPELFDDSKSVVPNKGEFIEHRHDQSNISILCKLNECCDGTDLEFIKRGFSRE